MLCQANDLGSSDGRVVRASAPRVADLGLIYSGAVPNWYSQPVA